MKWICTYQSHNKGNKTNRRKAKNDIKRGKEPLLVYRTGKLWND